MRRLNTSTFLFAALLITQPALAKSEAEIPAPTAAPAEPAQAAGETKPAADEVARSEAKSLPRLSRDEICDMIESAAGKEALPVPFFARLIWRESRFDPTAVSPAGAMGIAQFMPGTANGRGLEDPFDPLPALLESAEYLRELLRQFGNLGLAAAAYNAGPKRVQDWLAKKGILKQETHDYVEVITGHSAAAWAAEHPSEQAVPQDFRCDEITKFVREVRKPAKVAADAERPALPRNAARNRLLGKGAAGRPDTADLAGKRETQGGRNARGGNGAPSAKAAKMAELRRKAADQKRHGEKPAGRKQVAANRAGAKPTAVSAQGRRKLVELSDRRAGSSKRGSRTAASTHGGEKACTKGGARKACHDA
jgi:hypothetical protein